jgi:hypothetical protein
MAISMRSYLLTALLLGCLCACTSLPYAMVRELEVRSSTEVEGATDISVDTLLCFEVPCVRVYLYYLSHGGRQVVCVELPGLTSRPRCEEVR